MPGVGRGEVALPGCECAVTVARMSLDRLPRRPYGRAVPAPDPVERLREAINSHDPRQVADCFTAGYRCEVPHRPAEGFTGSDHVVRNWTGIFERLPTLHARVLRRAESDAEVWSEWEMAATNAPDAPVLLCGPVVMTTVDGKIDWTRFYLAPVTPPGP
jgi:hypothetical protein